MDKLLLTPTEAAALGIGRSKLYQLLRAGTVASVRIGGCRRVPAASLPELVARLQADAVDLLIAPAHSQLVDAQISPLRQPSRPHRGRSGGERKEGR